jgi:cytochrome c-type biogenesis protein CcmH
VTIFIILAAVLTAIAVLLIAWPVLRSKGEDGQKASVSPKAVAATVVVALPLLAFGIYFHLSDWWTADRSEETQAHGNGNAASLQQMADKLEARLRREAGDADGWKMLGRTYVVMGDFPKALNAYQHAFTLTSGNDVDAMLGYAEAKVLVNEADFEGEAGQLFRRAVAQEPENPKALWYAGLTAFRSHDLETARRFWSALREIGGPKDIMQILDQRLAEIDKQLGTAAATTPVEAPAPPQAAAGMTSDSGAKVAGGGIALHVELAPQLADRVPRDAPLFILARNGTAGPPLVAIRRSASSLPMDVTLTDADAMVPGTSLEQAGPLSLVARVSLTGRPIASTGDLYGEVGYDPSSSGRITLTIDKVVD